MMAAALFGFQKKLAEQWGRQTRTTWSAHQMTSQQGIWDRKGGRGGGGRWERAGMLGGYQGSFTLTIADVLMHPVHRCPPTKHHNRMVLIQVEHFINTFICQTQINDGASFSIQLLKTHNKTHKKTKTKQKTKPYPNIHWPSRFTLLHPFWGYSTFTWCFCCL